MFNLGFPELVFLLVIILVLFGGSRLPALGKGLGEGIKNFRQGLRSGDDEGPAAPSGPQNKQS
ncbi:MAG: twin-arginine translocase TatA/TatE family subunit [Acidobacteriota bacterium]